MKTLKNRIDRVARQVTFVINTITKKEDKNGKN